MYDLVLSQLLSIIKFCRATSWVKWLKGEDKDRDGHRNVGFFTFQPLDLAVSQRELHYNNEVLKSRSSVL